MSIYFSIVGDPTPTNTYSYGCFGSVDELIMDDIGLDSWQGFRIEVAESLSSGEQSQIDEPLRNQGRELMWNELIAPYFKPSQVEIIRNAKGDVSQVILSKDVPYYLIVPATWMWFLDTQYTNSSLRYVWYRNKGISPIIAYFATIQGLLIENDKYEQTKQGGYWDDTKAFADKLNKAQMVMLTSVEQIPFGTTCSKKEAILSIFNKSHADFDKLNPPSVDNSGSLSYWGRDSWWSGGNVSGDNYDNPPVMFKSFDVYNHRHFKKQPYRGFTVSFNHFMDYIYNIDQQFRELTGEKVA